MKLSGPSGQTIRKDLLTLILIILPFWNVVGGSIPFAKQQEQGTETPTVEMTDTASPSETPSSTATETETATPTFEAPTTTLTPFLATEALADNAPTMSDQSLSGEFASGEVLIRFRKRASKESIRQCAQSLDASIASEIGELHAFVLSVPQGKVVQSIFNLESCPDLLYAEPNYLAQIADVVPSDPGWGSQYGLKNIHAPQGWSLTTGSPSVTIAIVDTGIDRTHPDLAGKLVGGTDIVNGDNDPQDDNGHGSHVAGIAGAVSDNSLGVAGVSWGARLMPVKVLNALGRGSYANVANGILWATDHGAQIINLSLGGDQPSQTLQDAVDYAASHGVIIVAASGNQGRNSVMYPARYSHVIAVGATDSSDTRYGMSNYGPEIDLSAPGVSIYSTERGGYGYRTGTSMAAPFVSGLAAILRGLPGNSSPDGIAQQMESTARDLGSAGRDNYYGYGLIQMDAAVRLVWQAPASPTPSPTTAPASPTPLPSSTATTPSNSHSNPGIGFVGVSTLPPTWTATPPPMQPETETPSPTFTSTDAPPPMSEEAEVIALDTSMPAETEAKRDTNLFLPCLGVLFIVLGILLFWLDRRSRNRKRIKLIRFR